MPDKTAGGNSCCFIRHFLRRDVFEKQFYRRSNPAEALEIYAARAVCNVLAGNGIEKTKFVMIQGIAGAFLVRIPVAFLMQQIGNGSLFKIGLATPCSTVLQILMCFVVYLHFTRSMSVSENALIHYENSTILD